MKLPPFTHDRAILDSRRLFLTLLCACGAIAAGIDSSSAIFNDAKIHAYELSFYYPDWEDSLKYYKSLPDEEYIPARFLYRMSSGDSIVFDSIGVRYKGNSSYNFAANSPKKPFKFRFDKYRDNQRFFGVERLNFSNAAKDPTMMREKIAYDILGAYMPAPRTAFATITIEGSLIGLYTQIEQVDKIFLARHFGDNDFNLYKSSDNGSTLQYEGPNQSSYESHYELKTNEALNDWSGFIDVVDKLNNTPAQDFIRTVGGCLNLDIVCRYLAFNMVTSNFDSYTGSARNYYLYDDSTGGKFVLIPWDLNLSFGAYPNNWNVTTMDVVTVSNLAQRPLNRRILENDSLRRVYLRYIEEMINGPASTDSIVAKAAALRTLIDSCARADSNKLHPYDQFVANIDTSVSVTDGIARTTIPGLRLFSEARSAALRTQLDAYLPVVRGATGAHRGASLLSATCRAGAREIVIRFTTAKENAPFSLAIFDCRGVCVDGRTGGRVPAGTHRYVWDAAGCATGYYMVRLSLNNAVADARALTVLR
ncbi:MAG: CotH kinase family protein [Chitinispirillaceae bacterium]|nr:CotH kinase family protein [Chitinispirillaceae bacterium]